MSSPTASATPAPTTSATATPAASGIYHQGRLELASGTCADLDAPPSDSQWGELSANPDAGGGDLCSQYPSFVGVNGATLVTVNSGTDTTCQNATGWLAANYYKDLNLSVGSFVCVHTNQGRYSLLRVAAINSADNSIVFSVKTFKKPGDPAASGGSGTSASGGSTGIYHQGRLELASGTCADLDAPPSDSQWGELSANPDAGGGDLCSQYPSFVGVNGATLVTVNSGTDTTCQNATGWLAANYYKDLNLSVGSFVCVHTNQGRYSLLRVAAINSADNSIVFSVKTFKKPGD